MIGSVMIVRNALYVKYLRTMITICLYATDVIAHYTRDAVDHPLKSHLMVGIQPHHIVLDLQVDVLTSSV